MTVKIQQFNFRKINKAKQHVLQKYCKYYELGLSSRAKCIDDLN